MLRALFTIGLITLCFLLEAKTSDTLSLRFNWQGIHTVNPPANFNTLKLDGAIYLPDYNYLPGYEIKGVDGKIENLQIAHWEGDTLNVWEEKIFARLYKKGISQFQKKTLKRENDHFTNILFFPFFYDSLEHRFYKITAVKIKYDKSFKEQALQANAARTAGAANSVLATGDWYKIAVQDNAVYKIDRDFLEQMGIDAGKIDPEKLKIYGNGGGMLPQKNDAPRQEDLFENAIIVQGGGDGSFDESDFILFYGQSPHKIKLDPETGEVLYEHNFYTDTTYYFLTTSGAEGKRIPTRESSGEDYPEVNSYTDLQFYENDLVNILNSGRKWFGERFDATLTRQFQFNLEGAVPGSAMQITAAVLGQSYSTSSMDVFVNNENIGEISLPSIPQGTYFSKGIEAAETFLYSVKAGEGPEFQISLAFNKAGGGSSSAYLNYLTLACERSLAITGKQLLFRSPESLMNANATFSIKNTVDRHQIWDVSSPLEPVKQRFSLLSENQALFGVATGKLREFIVFDPQSAPHPVFVKAVRNQDLRGQPAPDLVIVSHPDFLAAASRLAAHRRSHSGLDVLVTTSQIIYNEFSSGAQDVTAIRDMVKHFYDKGGPDKLDNLLLFGKCSYDYKNIEAANNTNFVPTYSSRNSAHPVNSYSSDDYYGFLEDGEGEWEESYSGDHTLDIGVGRLPVKTAEEAEIVVDKLIHYDANPKSFGEWRNQLTFIADDGDGNIHQEDAEELANYLDTAYARFNVNKIYVDAFPQVRAASGEAAPEVNNAINNAISKGSLLVNFTGHGSETRWCSETVLDINTIRKWTNLDHLPLFVTATCEFGKHDDPAITSGAEYLLLNPEGGAIGLVTTSRPVYSNTNFDINMAFYKSVFKKGEEGYRDLGAIFKDTKNGSLRGSNNRNFSLLGDPSMKLAIAENDVMITAEAENAKAPGDTLSALELIKLNGKIVDLEGEKLAGFEGRLTATVFDKAKTVQTLGNEGAPFSYSQRNNIIFKGEVSVVNGEFSLRFVVPKSISYQLKKGKISMYAYSESSTSDAAGSNLTFTIGGSGDFLPDHQPPDIELFINDTTFAENNITGENIIALAKIFDENGVNILNDELNRGIVVSIDNEDFKYAGDFFKNELDSYQAGWLRYPYFDLNEGHHTIVVGAYDTHNNYSEREIAFYVSSSEQFTAQNLFNYPNPFSEKTTFTFEHNRGGEDLEFYLDIFDLEGRKVFSGRYTSYSSPGTIDHVNWDGHSASGKKLEPGIYVYVVRIRSLKDSANIRLSNKLLIIN